jgi:hypothetical protein
MYNYIGRLKVELEQRKRWKSAVNASLKADCWQGMGGLGGREDFLSYQKPGCLSKHPKKLK